mgnify:FL=1
MVIGTVAGVAGQVSAGKAAKKNAAEQRAYNLEVERKQKVYRRDVISYQNSQYANDIDFYNKGIQYQQDEFGKYEDQAQDQIAAIDRDFFGMLAAQMTKEVEQNMGEAFGLIETASAVRTETGTLETRVADSGVGGNVTNMMRGDVQRQGGDASNMISLNADAVNRQTRLELSGLKAQRENQLSAINIPAFQPLAPPPPPAPVNPIQAAAPVARQSSLAIGLSALSSGITMGMQGAQFGSTIQKWRAGP